ncbi:MAG TPA: hypothetical protein VGQ74_08070 [Methylomirabilota bacterium]|jgi:hypothetical protein|nr:hypothetical protein [Methylomirabilota bacterium]
MSEIVERIRAKVTRAKQHIQDFQLGLKAFYDTKPYTIDIKEYAQAGKRIYYVTKADPVPDQLAAIGADVIQNLRSPLDHIAYQLVLDARDGAEPDWPVYYPICGNAANYPTLRNGNIKGVRQAVIDAIDATEPYKGGKGHALWQLNELNKPDKHRLLIGTGSISSGVDIAPTLRASLAKMLEQMPGAPKFDASMIKPLFLRPADKSPLKVGDELYIEPLGQEVHQDRGFTFDVSLNAPGVVEGEPALKTFQDLTNLVDAVVIGLGKLLP